MRALLHVQDEPRRLHERVVSDCHRRGSRMIGPPLEDDRAARLAGDRRHDSERLACAFEHRPLLDVQLEEGLRQLGQGAAAHRPGLFGAEGYDSERRVTQACCRLDPGEDAEHAVVPAAARHRVEVRAGPHTGLASATDQVPGSVDLDLQACFAHPVRGQPMRLVLLCGVAGAVADRRDPLDPLEELHRASVVAYIRPR